MQYYNLWEFGKFNSGTLQFVENSTSSSSIYGYFKVGGEWNVIQIQKQVLLLDTFKPNSSNSNSSIFIVGSC